MPALIWIGAIISRIFATRLGSWIASAMVFLGLQWGVQEFAMQPVLAEVQAAVGGVGGPGAQWIGFFNLDRYVTIIVSAYAVAAGKQAVLRRRAGP